MTPQQIQGQAIESRERLDGAENVPLAPIRGEDLGRNLPKQLFAKRPSRFGLKFAFAVAVIAGCYAAIAAPVSWPVTVAAGVVVGLMYAHLVELVERIAKARRLKAQGRRTAEIAYMIGVCRQTVRRYLHASSCPRCGHRLVVEPDSRACWPCALDERKAWTKDAVVHALAEWSRQTGSTPTASDWGSCGGAEGNHKWLRDFPRWPSHRTVRRLFGSWNTAVMAAGLTPNKRPWTAEQCLAAIRRWARRHGRPPRARDWRRSGPDHPPQSTVVLRFGAWSSALEAAGVRIRRRASEAK